MQILSAMVRACKEIAYFSQDKGCYMSRVAKLTGLLKEAGIEINGRQAWDLRLQNPRALERMAKEPSLGAGESYMDGWWDCDQLDEFFFKIWRFLDPKRIYTYSSILSYWLQNLLFNPQSRRFSKQVAKRHYNLDHRLYEAMLGKSMAYSCGYWRQTQSLDQAQFAKYDLICRKLGLRSGEKVLEMGCGFGGFSKFAAENYGVSLVSINISSEQMRFARKLCEGLPIQLVECDYRDINRYNPQNIKFDKVVSIGFFEHIGYQNYQTFMQVTKDNLKKDGLVLLQTVGKNISHAFTDPWIQKYIFPHGMLPTIKLISQAAEQFFVIEDIHNFGVDYDKTLMAWNENFENAWSELSVHYNECFRRMWRYYLLSCAGAFRARAMELYQVVFSPSGVLNGYASLR